MSYIVYPFLALAPSTIWLLFYLRKDSHPESNRMILRVFLFGMLMTVPVGIIQLGAGRIVSALVLPQQVHSFIYFFAVVALSEEFFKYFAAKKMVFSTSELDEPLDIMLYMIIAALGFAAAENLLYLNPLRYVPELGFSIEFSFAQSFALALQRFIGATLLHALASGTLGYFLARTYFKPKNATTLLIFGFTIAVGLHGFFNFSIMEIDGWLKPAVPLAILVGLALFVSWGFGHVKRTPSICFIVNSKIKSQKPECEI